MTQQASSRKFAAIVLAAGKSTRMRSKTPKALHPIVGKPVIEHILEALKVAGAERIVIVIGHHADHLRAGIGNSYEYVVQEDQRGTGHAVRMAEDLLADWNGPVIVLPGDAPLVTADAIAALLVQHADRHATMLTVQLANPTGYGRVVRNESGVVLAVVEEKDATTQQRTITEVCVSVYAFSPQFLFPALNLLSPENSQGELYLTEIIRIASDQQMPVSAFPWHDSDVGRGINNRIELAEAASILRKRILNQHMLAGVTIVDPNTIWIDAAVKIGADTVVQPFTMLNGVTDIGEDCVIGPGARIVDSQIGNGVKICDSHITSSEVGDESTVGPFANLRPGSIIGKHVKIGDFVETKQSTLGDHVSAGHFAYLGDATIGAGANIGAGTITCNYDGVAKHQTTIGRDAFIGSNSTLVAPVEVGDGSYVAAGSTITENVPAGSLAIGRARQLNKPGWVKTRNSARRD